MAGRPERDARPSGQLPPACAGCGGDQGLWFAASDGVYRYDGKSFTNITGKLISVPIFCILEDRKGNFWFGTYGSGAYYYDGKSFQNFTTRNGHAHNSVMPIYEDKAGIIWLGTGGGVSRYDGKTFTTFSE